MDERADIFALGAILYEVLVGRPPYRGSSNIETLRMAQRCEIISPDDLEGANMHPREIVRITMKALARAPSERYRTTEELKQDLQRLIRGGGNFPAITYKTGTHVIREGEVGDAAYIVESGQLEVYKSVDGERVSLRMLGSRDVFGETAIFAESPRTASVVAVTDTTLIMVTGEVIEREFDAMKPWMGAFIKTLANRFREAESRRMSRAPRSVPRSATRAGRSPFDPPASSPFPAPASDSLNSSVEIDLGEMEDSAAIDLEVDVDVVVEDSDAKRVSESDDVEVDVEFTSTRMQVDKIVKDSGSSTKPWWKR
jgi:serine/threonine-protein kinase